jgi:TonB family protein
MSARVRKDGKYISLEPGDHTLKKGDVAHVQYFTTRFFFVHKTLPNVHVPRGTLEDPLFTGLLACFFVSYIFLCFSFYLVEVPEKETNIDEIWAVVEKGIEIEPKKVDVEEIKKEKVEEKKEVPKKDLVQEMEQLNKALVASEKKETPKKSVNQQDQKKTVPVEAARKKESSGLNLSTAGLGLGNIKSHGGLGAIPSKLNKADTGTAEGGAKKTFGLGGVGKDLSKADLMALNTKAAKFADASKSLADGNVNSEFEREGSAELQIHSGDPLLKVRIDKKAVWDVLMSAQRAINHCYNTLLQRDRTAAGTLTLSIIVDSTGKAPKSKVEKSEITDSVMQECVLNVIRRLTFPKPEGVSEVEFKMPYSFSPEA